MSNGRPAVAGLESGGWWAIDVMGCLLTRLEALPGDLDPAAMDAGRVVTWIRRNEIAWAPGSSDPANDIPWRQLRAAKDDAELVEQVLSKAVAEVEAAHQTPAGDGDAPILAARRLVPTSTLHAYGLNGALTGAHDVDFADGHVHQGAALPFEVTLRWAAMLTDSIGTADLSQPLTDTDERAFNPKPLLLLLRNVIERPAVLDGTLLKLARDAALGDPDMWSALNAKAGFAESSTGGPMMLDAVRVEKEAARTSWSPLRRIARLRIEAILLAAVTQRKAGLDVFVDLFEQFSALRRGRVPKVEYFERSITTHAVQSKHRLRGLELRLGERVAAESHTRDALERTYAAALNGYRCCVAGDDHPIKVAFPLGLVKSARRPSEQSEHWRFDPRGIFALTESLLEMLEVHPHLRPFVDGIDVCGLEECEPNWLFAPAFERFATATAGESPRPACRFHAGEWQWTPLHGLRRIGEFLRFSIPTGTPRRIGHGLALCSNDWHRLGEQPIDELLDDLIWTHRRLDAIPCAADTRRLVERLALDLRRSVYVDSVGATATIAELRDAYDARFEVDALERISFVAREGDRLTFPDFPPAFRTDTRSQLLVSHLAQDGIRRPSLASAIGTSALADRTLSDLYTTLLELYEALSSDLIDELRWGGVIIEACPTSNVLAGGVRGYGTHPVRALLERGLLTTINTDDPSIFHSWMGEELAHVQHMGIPPRTVGHSRELGLRTVAPGLSDGDGDIRLALDAAIGSLESPRIP